MSHYPEVLGIDIGGTGIKGAIVELEKGTFLTDRFRLDTPRPATPEAVADTFGKVVSHFNWKGGPIGVGFPAIVKKGVAHSAANIHSDWVGKDVGTLLSEAVGQPVWVINDADAAGLAAVLYGIGRHYREVVLFVTIGTGIGSALFIDGQLVPNTEFGHIYLNGDIAEKSISKKVMKEEQLTAREWGQRLNKFFNHIDRILSPDVIIVGGGGGKKFEEFAPFLDLREKVRPSMLMNNAGIIGAALNAYQLHRHESDELSDPLSGEGIAI